MDRRPLDPPPVIQLKLFRVHDIGTDHEEEEEMTYELRIIFPLLFASRMLARQMVY